MLRFKYVGHTSVTHILKIVYVFEQWLLDLPCIQIPNGLHFLHGVEWIYTRWITHIEFTSVHYGSYGLHVVLSLLIPDGLHIDTR